MHAHSLLVVVAAVSLATSSVRAAPWFFSRSSTPRGLDTSSMYDSDVKNLLDFHISPLIATLAGIGAETKICLSNRHIPTRSTCLTTLYTRIQGVTPFGHTPDKHTAKRVGKLFRDKRADIGFALLKEAATFAAAKANSGPLPIMPGPVILDGHVSLPNSTDNATLNATMTEVTPVTNATANLTTTTSITSAPTEPSVEVPSASTIADLYIRFIPDLRVAATLALGSGNDPIILMLRDLLGMSRRLVDVSIAYIEEMARTNVIPRATSYPVTNQLLRHATHEKEWIFAWLGPHIHLSPV